jgi:NAD(P)-dependent dehydrogenase (short-subunit alcohol dehydrogenase family)
LTTDGAFHLQKQYKINTLVVDLTEDGSYAAIGDALKSILIANKGSKLYCVVNNAGIAPIGFTDWMSMDAFRKAMEVNYFACIGVVKELLPYLKQNKGSRIINLSSMAGKAAGCSFGPYSGSKHALEGWSKALRFELLPYDIKVCNVNPGFMNTPLIDNSLKIAEEALENSNQDIKRFYDTREVMQGNADAILKMKEPLNTVGDYIVDYLLVANNPCFNHFVGWQASMMRWYLVFPQVIQELLSNTFTPVKGVLAEEVKKEHLCGNREAYNTVSSTDSSVTTSTSTSKRGRSKSKSRPRNY